MGRVSYDYILIKPPANKSFMAVNFNTDCEVRIYCEGLFSAKKRFTFSPTTAPKEIQRRINEVCSELHRGLVLTAEKALADFLAKCNAELMGG